MGKTTLAKQLWSHPRMQELGMEIQHLSRLPTGHDRCMHYINRMNQSAIFDRFYLSEIAYALARNDEKILFTQEHFRVVHGFACTLGAFTVLLTGEPGVIHGRWDKEEMYDKETVIMADAAFRNLQPFCDWHYHQTHSLDFVTCKQVEEIVDAYCKRRAFIDSVL